MTSTHLNGHHRKILARIFAHPAGHNVEWHDVLSLLGHVGSVEVRHDGGNDVTIAAETIKLGPPHGHDLGAGDMRDLRSFLTRVGLANEGLADGEEDETAAETGCTVLIDHHEARLFGLDGSANPSKPRVLKPEDVDGAIRRVEHKQGQDDHDVGHGLEEDVWYERIAAELTPARRIVVLSDGKGRSNAGSYLIAYLGRHHPAVAKCIVSVQRVDIAHLSDGEIAAMGRDLLAA